MLDILLNTGRVSGDAVEQLLREKKIRTNDHGRIFMSHRDFGSEDLTVPVCLRILSVEELGIGEPAVIGQILKAAENCGLCPCAPAAALFLRLQLMNQEISSNSLLTGTHSAPEGSITVVSRLLEQDPDFPRGLYLRNVDGILWLRGYICDDAHLWQPTDVLAFAVAKDGITV